MQARRSLFVSAVSMAEVLRNDQPTPSTTAMPHVPGLTVVAFDERCAVELGARVPVDLVRQMRDESGEPLGYWKFDALLVATALRYKVGVFVTLDEKAQKLARRAGVRAAAPAEFLKKEPAQGELFSSDSDE